MKEKLFDSEAKVMEIIWNRGPLSAKEISLIAADSIGWNKNTTYTVIKKLESKGFIKRTDPGFICTPLVSQEEMQKKEAVSRHCFQHCSKMKICQILRLRNSGTSLIKGDAL